MTQWLLDLFASLGLPGVFILMTIESSFIPFPSEVVMIPAGMVAAQGGYNVWIVTVVGGLGSLAGAWVNYGVGKYLGRPFFTKYGKYFLFNAEKFAYSERLFMKNPNLYTFVGRLLPAVRQLISIPAGMFGMNPWMFSLLTFVGATMWSGVLVYLGYVFWDEAIRIVDTYTRELMIAVVIGCAALGIWILTRPSEAVSGARSNSGARSKR